MTGLAARQVALERHRAAPSCGRGRRAMAAAPSTPRVFDIPPTINRQCPDHGVLPTHRLAQARQRPEQEPSRWIFGPHRDMDVNRRFTLKSIST